MRAAVFAAAFGAAMALDHDEVPVRVAHVQTSHEGHMDGWTLHSVWTAHEHFVQQNILSEGPTVKKLRREASAQASVDLTKPSKARTMLALRLCVAQVGALSADELAEDPEVLDEMLKEDNLFFTQKGSAAAEEMTAVYETVKAVHDNLAAEMASTQDLFRNVVTPVPAQSNEDQAERANVAAQITAIRSRIVAHVWQSVTSRSAVLVFRGSFDTIDYADSAMLSAAFQLSKTAARMKQSWTQLAGLKWTDSQSQIEAARASRANYTEAVRREALLTVGTLYQLNGVGPLTTTGLMKVVLAIGQAFAAYVRQKQMRPMLTGYSLGGARAAGVSMMLAKVGLTVPTLTFGGIDSTCWPRGLLSGAGYQAAVDPYVAHPQITDYAHPLDRYGNNLGMESGNQCWLGLKNEAMLNKVARWCESTFAQEPGYVAWLDTAPMVQRAATLAMLSGNPVLAAQFKALQPLVKGFLTPLSAEDMLNKKRAKQCNYLAHSPISYLRAVEEEILPDGQTSSGCVAPEPIPRGDHRCTWNFHQEVDDDEYKGSAPYYAMIVLLCVAFVVMVGSFAYVLTRAPAAEEVSEEEMAKKPASSSE